MYITFQDHKLKELLQKRTEIQHSLNFPTPMEDEDAPDARLSGDEDNGGESESDDNFSSYEEELEKGLGQEEVNFSQFSHVLRIRILSCAIIFHSDADPGCLSRIQIFPTQIRIKEFKYFNQKKGL
jgi:hypothetical protein